MYINSNSNITQKLNKFKLAKQTSQQTTTKMLKFSIVLAICALFVSQSDAWSVSHNWGHLLNLEVWKDRVGHVPLNGSECVFFRDEGVLGCVGGVKSTLVTCPGVLNMTGLDQGMFGAFAVGVDTLNEVNTATIMHMFPSLVDYPFYMVSRLALRGIPIEFSLHDTDLTVFGIRVTDTTCFAGLLQSLRLWSTNEIFTVRSFELVKPTAVRLTELFVV